MSALVLIDFGSTFTKLTAVDLRGPSVLARLQAPTTVKTDIRDGFEEALELLVWKTGRPDLKFAPRLASSSAAGGLRMIVSGLIPKLTSEAARRAALGAGAKVVGVFSFTLTDADVEDILAAQPDIVLLTGGTDGGDRKTIVENALALARSAIDCPIVVAGNRTVGKTAQDCLIGAGKKTTLTSNVMPEFGQLDVDPTRGAIQEIFIEHITKAKGLDEIQRTCEQPVIPTPLAVLKGAELLALGAGATEGAGDLLLVDVGGATTDVDSITKGEPAEPGVMTRGLPEPFAKRTVEGDLGIRFNAGHIIETAPETFRLNRKTLGSAADEDGELAIIASFGSVVSKVPEDDQGYFIDAALARTAVELAVQRHAGRITYHRTSEGDVALLDGKDLRRVGTVIGTGGIFAHGKNPRYVLEAAGFDLQDRLSLRPVTPDYYIDKNYVFYALGLLAQHEPEAAAILMKANLVRI